MAEEIDKDKIVANAEHVSKLIEILGLKKPYKEQLMKYRAFVYNDWDDGGYVNRNVYLYNGIYYHTLKQY